MIKITLENIISLLTVLEEQEKIYVTVLNILNAFDSNDTREY